VFMLGNSSGARGPRADERVFALARRAGRGLAGDPLGGLVAMAASAGDLAPAVALAALRHRAAADRGDGRSGTGVGRRLGRMARTLRHTARAHRARPAAFPRSSDALRNGAVWRQVVGVSPVRSLPMPAPANSPGQ
jgi:hypothetical protein